MYRIFRLGVATGAVVGLAAVASTPAVASGFPCVACADSCDVGDAVPACEQQCGEDFHATETCNLIPSGAGSYCQDYPGTTHVVECETVE